MVSVQPLRPTGSVIARRCAGGARRRGEVQRRIVR